MLTCRPKKLQVSMTAIVLMLGITSADSQETSTPVRLVRGIIMQELPDGSLAPARHVKVELYSIMGGANDPGPFSAATGSNGMYYFEEIPSGEYEIQVSRLSAGEKQIFKYALRIPSVDQFDAPPIHLTDLDPGESPRHRRDRSFRPVSIFPHQSFGDVIAISKSPADIVYRFSGESRAFERLGKLSLAGELAVDHCLVSLAEEDWIASTSYIRLSTNSWVDYIHLTRISRDPISNSITVGTRVIVDSRIRLGRYSGITFDEARGRLLVADSDVGQVFALVLREDGEINKKELPIVSGLDKPIAVLASGEYIFIGDEGNDGTVYMTSDNGGSVDLVGEKIGRPSGLAVSRDGEYLLVTDRQGDRLIRIDYGTKDKKMSILLDGSSGLSAPSAVAVDLDNAAWISAQPEGVVVKYDLETKKIDSYLAIKR
ncbi:MAG: hypothetical protein GY835_22390 [bacterium]|nr:hypothetical protein [bacterium]